MRVWTKAMEKRMKWVYRIGEVGKEDHKPLSLYLSWLGTATGLLERHSACGIPELWLNGPGDGISQVWRLWGYGLEEPARRACGMCKGPEQRPRNTSIKRQERRGPAEERGERGWSMLGGAGSEHPGAHSVRREEEDQRRQRSDRISPAVGSGH